MTSTLAYHKRQQFFFNLFKLFAVHGTDLSNTKRNISLADKFLVILVKNLLRGFILLLDKPLILPERTGVQSELANWFGKDFNRLQIAYISNLGTNAGVLASKGAGYPISVEGAGRYWKEEYIVQKRLYPEITANTVIAWRRNIPNSPVVERFIEEIKDFGAWKKN